MFQPRSRSTSWHLQTAPSLAALIAGVTLSACAAQPGDPTARPSDAGAEAQPDADADPIPPDTIERTVALVLAAPDLPPQFVCLGGFETSAGGTPQGDPVIAGGPFGIPDPSDATGRRLLGGFPYGSVIRLPVRHRDARFYDGLVPVGYLVDDVSPREFAGAGNDSDTCKRAWASARDVPARQLALAHLNVGDAWIAGVSGCQQVSSAAECGGGANLRVDATALDLGASIPPAQAGDSTLTFQVADFSAFAGFDNVDFHLQPMRVAGDQTIPDGAPIVLSADDPGLARGRISSRAVGVRLAAANVEQTLLLVVPHGTPPSCIAGAGCATVAIPIQPFLSRYAAPMGGATGAAWAGHQVLALFGRPPVAGETPATVLRLGVFGADIP